MKELIEFLWVFQQEKTKLDGKFNAKDWLIVCGQKEKAIWMSPASQNAEIKMTDIYSGKINNFDVKFIPIDSTFGIIKKDAYDTILKVVRTDCAKLVDNSRSVLDIL